MIIQSVRFIGGSFSIPKLIGTFSEQKFPLISDPRIKLEFSGYFSVPEPHFYDYRHIFRASKMITL